MAKQNYNKQNSIIPFSLLNPLLKASFLLHLSAPRVCNLQKELTARREWGLQCYKLLITLSLVNTHTRLVAGEKIHSVERELPLTLWRNAKEVHGRSMAGKRLWKLSRQSLKVIQNFYGASMKLLKGMIHTVKERLVKKKKNQPLQWLTSIEVCLHLKGLVRIWVYSCDRVTSECSTGVRQQLPWE